MKQSRIINSLVENTNVEDLLHELEEESPVELTCQNRPTTERQELKWWIGLSLYAACQLVGSLIALNFISPMLFAPLGSSGLIFNLFFASYFFNNAITLYDWIGTLLIVCGCMVVSTFGVKFSAKETIDEIGIHFRRYEFLLYIGIVIGVVIFALITSQILVRQLGKMKESRRSLSFTSPIPAVISSRSSSFQRHTFLESKSVLLVSPSDIAIEQVESPIDDDIEPLLLAPLGITRSIKRGELSKLIGILFSISGGIIASMTLLLTKSGVELIRIVVTTGKGDFPLAAVLASILVITAVTQVLLLNAALRFELSVVVLPLFYTAFTSLSVVNTLLYLDSFGKATAIDLLCLAGGMLFIVFGVAIMAKKT